MTELEMYELWLTLREWANYNQLNQTIEKNWLSNSFNSHILDLLDKEEIKYRSEKRLLGYRNKGKRRLAGNANQPIVINIDDVADVIDVRAEDEFARVELWLRQHSMPGRKWTFWIRKKQRRGSPLSN